MPFLDLDCVSAMSFAARLKTLRKRMGLTQQAMADFFGKERPYYWQLENGDRTKITPGRKMQEEIELLEPLSDETLRTRAQEKLTDLASRKIRTPLKSAKPSVGGDIMRDVQITVPRYIPVLTCAEAGNILVAWENLPPHWAEKVPTDLSDPRAVAIKVQGDSMEPNFYEGDVVIVSPETEVHEGDVVIARLSDGATLLKLYHSADKGRAVHLASFNTKYPPHTYKTSEIEILVPVLSVIKDVRMSHIRRQF